MIRRSTIYTACVMLMLSNCAMAADPVAILQKSEQAGKNISYRGQKTAQIYFGGQLTTSTLKVLHKKPDKTRTDYFTPQVVAGIIVIQDGLRAWAYSPSLKAWEERAPALGASGDAQRAELAKNYDLKLAGTDKVAGRPAYVIVAVPHNPSEGTKRLWVDQSTYLVMGYQLENQSGGVVNSSRFTSIEINPRDISADAFKVTGRIIASALPGQVAFQVQLPGYLPSGYKLMSTSTVTINNVSCAHVQFSNGTNVISLFERKGDAKDVSPTPMKSKVTNVLTWSRNGMVFTLIGDVSSKELSKIADSMR